ncbi:2-polyprenyl-6-methoxyphenol hydroxylase-like oxidoreductase [Frankia sp. QA3]|nr:2-polyprenyl-6-methoxyphenol hydroxylase-like oxidoreductase [Frankia sp. QA3]
MPSVAARAGVLIVGAGPTGLLLAAELVRRGVRTRVAERASVRSPGSRALAVSSRTLMLLDDLGLAAEAVRRGHPLRQVEVHDDAARVVVTAPAGRDTRDDHSGGAHSGGDHSGGDGPVLDPADRARARYGAAIGEAVLVRPDGYLAYRSTVDHVGQLERHLRAHGITPAPAGVAAPVVVILPRALYSTMTTSGSAVSWITMSSNVSHRTGALAAAAK